MSYCGRDKDPGVSEAVASRTVQQKKRLGTPYWSSPTPGMWRWGAAFSFLPGIRALRIRLRLQLSSTFISYPSLGARHGRAK
jgi:hypothetical protein